MFCHFFFVGEPASKFVCWCVVMRSPAVWWCFWLFCYHWKLHTIPTKVENQSPLDFLLGCIFVHVENCNPNVKAIAGYFRNCLKRRIVLSVLEEEPADETVGSHHQSGWGQYRATIRALFPSLVPLFHLLSVFGPGVRFVFKLATVPIDPAFQKPELKVPVLCHLHYTPFYHHFSFNLICQLLKSGSAPVPLAAAWQLIVVVP